MNRIHLIVLKRIAHVLLKLSNELYSEQPDSVSFHSVYDLRNRVDMVLREHGCSQGSNATIDDLPLAPEYSATFVHFEELAPLTAYSMRIRNAIEGARLEMNSHIVAREIKRLGDDNS